jgi:hypothetical protein
MKAGETVKTCQKSFVAEDVEGDSHPSQCNTLT